MQQLVGRTVRFSKTVSESDVYLFAGISGDFYAVHVDEEAMRKTALGHRIAHGALIVGYMSAASTRLIEAADAPDLTPVSLGYDRIRFTAPVFFGDTVTVVYTVNEFDAARDRSVAEIEVRNQRDEVVSVATHILKWTRSTAR